MQLPLDPLGADLEGIAFVKADGSFWMCDEYRPALYHFDASGVLIRRVVPIGTAAAAGQPAGTFGEEWLPAVLAQRRQNRGFEGIAIDGGKIYAFVQSPLRNPATLSNAALNGLRNIRVVEFNPADQCNPAIHLRHGQSESRRRSQYPRRQNRRRGLARQRRVPRHRAR